MAESKFQVAKNRLSFKSQSRPSFALRCHFDRYAVNQSWLNWEGMEIRSDKEPSQFLGSHSDNMNEQSTHSEKKTSTHSSLPKAFSMENINIQFQ